MQVRGTMPALSDNVGRRRPSKKRKPKPMAALKALASKKATR